MRIAAPLSICLAATLAGCVSGNGRYDGVTTGAGNAIAANTVMQMVDPWQPGVQHTKLRVPAVRTSPDAASQGNAAAPSAAPSTTSN